jgi:hypothetical protein
MRRTTHLTVLRISNHQAAGFIPIKYKTASQTQTKKFNYETLGWLHVSAYKKPSSGHP